MRGGNDAAYGHKLSMKSLASYNLIVNNRGVRCLRNNPPPTPKFEIHSRCKKTRVRSGLHFSLLTDERQGHKTLFVEEMFG